jgi:HNH endonuclease
MIEWEQRNTKTGAVLEAPAGVTQRRIPVVQSQYTDFRTTPARLQNFWSKIDKNGSVPPHRPELGPCWEWRGQTNPGGYGYFHAWNAERGKWQRQLAHRMAYHFVRGPFLTKLCVLHQCDNPICCNPDHLKLGTLKDNSRDMVAKGRMVFGRAKITRELAEEIRTRYAAGETSRVALAEEYGVTRSNIDYIVRRKSWA